MGIGALLGRDSILQGITQALAPPGALVTLTGLPGAGTTALALAAVDEAAEPRYCVVEGRRASEPGALAAALEGCGSAQLVFIDDVEHAPDARETLRHLRRSRPDLRLVVTSRTPVGLRGEVVVRVPPLPVPRLNEDTTALRQQPAVALFLDVAARTGTTAAMEDPGLEQVAGICRRLGGLPLAIALVAARSATYSPATLVRLLDQTPAQLLRPRESHLDHDLMSALTWSVSLLTPGQQALLHDLTVFGTPVTVEVIEKVCARPDLVDELSALVDVHLVEPHHAGGATSRFSLHPLLRDHLRDAQHGPHRQDLLERHHRWARGVARTAVTLDEVGHLSDAVRHVGEAEHDLAAALTDAIRCKDAASATILALALLPLWFNRGAVPQRLVTTEQTLALWAEDVLDDRTPGSGTAGAGDLHDRLVLAAWCVLLRAELALTPEDVAAAVPETERLRERARAAGERTLLLVTYLTVQAARSMADRSAPLRWAQEGRELSLRLGEPARTVRFETWLGMLAHQRGELTLAAEWGGRAFARSRSLADPTLGLAPAALLHGLPSGAMPEMDLPSPARLVALAREWGDLRTLDWLEPTAAFVALRHGDLPGAARHCAATLRRARTASVPRNAGPPTLCLFLLAVRRADLRWAGRLHGVLNRSIEVLRPALPPAAAVLYDQGVAAYRSQAGAEAEGDMMWGEALSAEEALDTALAYAAELSRSRARAAPAEVQGDWLRRHTTDGPDRRGGAPPVRPMPRPGEDDLTHREQEVMSLLASGGTNREISTDLGISAKTVMHHTSNIYRKLGVRGRAEAVAWHLRQGRSDRDAGLRLVAGDS